MPRATRFNRAHSVLTGNLEAWLAALAATLTLAAIGFVLGCTVAGVGAGTPSDEAHASAVTAVAGGMLPVDRPVPPRWPLRASAAAPDENVSLSIAAPVAGGRISSFYGPRLDPFSGLPAHHAGLDFTGLPHSAILAAAAGVVAWSGSRAGYGNFIEIDHGNGWVTRYGHNAMNLVVPGDYVRPGQTIALMGDTGRATGTHLHFEVRYRGRALNPAHWLPPSA